MDTEADRLAFLHPRTSRIGARIAARDWADTELGPPGGWPPALKATLGLMLSCPTPMFLAWGPDLRSFYNDAYEPVLGYRAPNALGARFRDLWASIWDDIGPLVAATLRGESCKVQDMRLDISRDGHPEESYWTFSYSPALDDEGRIAGLFCVTNETTRRLLAERERGVADDRLHLALSAGDGIGTWDWDINANRITADIRFASLYGVDADRAAHGAPLEEFFTHVHPDDLPRLQQEIEEAVATLGSLHTEYRLIQKDGSVRWVSAQGRCIADAEGRPARFPGATFDITPRKLAELELRAAKNEREFVLDLIAHQRAMSDPDDILHHASRALGERLGVDRAGDYRVVDGARLRRSGTWTAGPLPPFDDEEAVDRFGPFVAREGRQGRPIVFSDSTRDADGSLGGFLAGGVRAAVCVPLMAGDRWAAGICLHQASARDWTAAEVALVREVAAHTWLAVERAEAQMRLARWLDLQDAALLKGASELEEQHARRKAAEEQVRHFQKMELVGQLTGGIAHDFNNMLAIIISGLNLTRRRLRRGDTDVDAFIGGALDGAQRAAALTQRLLAFARQQPLSPTSVQVNDLIGNLLDLLGRSLGERVTLETEFAPDIWTAQVDPGQLENAIINLAVNAKDAMPEGGRLRIRTDNTELDAATAADPGLEPGRWVRITVSDTGTGMSADTLARASEPFFTTKGVGKGTGLGLSQVFGFVTQSGGHMRIRSHLQEGTEVTLYLPRSAAAPSLDAERPTRALQPARPGDIILVVEDEEQVRKFSLEALRDLGYTVLEAPGGAEALGILSRDPSIRLLFTDVVMPGMTGRQLAEQALRQRPDLRVLFTSGYTRGEFAPGTRGHDTVDLLPKPFSIEDLSAHVRKVLDR